MKLPPLVVPSLYGKAKELSERVSYKNQYINITYFQIAHDFVKRVRWHVYFGRIEYVGTKPSPISIEWIRYMNKKLRRKKIEARVFTQNASDTVVQSYSENASLPSDFLFLWVNT